MNRSKIEWCDHTWNPITGCKYDCPYCYARKRCRRFEGNVKLNKMSDQCVFDEKLQMYVLKDPFASDNDGYLTYPFGFEPTLHLYRFDYLSKLKNGNNVFVGSETDIFGDWVPDEVVERIFETCKKYPLHNYLFMTKNVERYERLSIAHKLPTDENMWYGYTITDNTSKHFSLVGYNTFANIEPILEDIDFNKVDCNAKWLIVGAETGIRRAKVKPERDWINGIVDYCNENHIPVFMRDSLKDIVCGLVQEVPTQLKNKKVSEKVKQRLEGNCAKCGVHLPKNKMIAICARKKRGEMAKQIAHLCQDCYKMMCKEFGVEEK